MTGYIPDQQLVRVFLFGLVIGLIGAFAIVGFAYMYWKSEKDKG